MIYYCTRREDDIISKLTATEIAINERVAIIRKDLGLTLKEFGAAMGVGIDAIKNIEYMRTPAKDYLLKLLRERYEVNLRWLMTGEGEKTVSSPTQTDLRRKIEEYFADADEGFKFRLLRAFVDAGNTLTEKQLQKLTEFLESLSEE